MQEVVELENVRDVCRLCLSTDEPRSSVFAEHEQDAAVSLVVKIQACLSIQIAATDKLSTFICANCVKSVNQWHTYKESCLRSQDKLQEWLANQLQSNPTIVGQVTIKEEPMDFEYDSNIEIISESSTRLDSDPLAETVEDDETNNKSSSDTLENNAKDANEEKDHETTSPATEANGAADQSTTDKQDTVVLYAVKSEPPDDYDTDCTIDIETVSNDLLLNPTVTTRDDTIMEADSTQKSNVAGGRSSPKRKLKRGPHTHFRGARVFKRKCVHCQIFLHSKYTYTKHMERFHDMDAENLESLPQNEDEEMVEDLEDELVSMEQDSPLTQVQQDIISQLKTFSCYSCEQTFNDRRTTLSHIRQHLPDLRPYTCIACLTEFSDRSMYQLHCGASFECAMKIALVVPKHGNEKYFTCNMCLRPMQNRKELLSHLLKHSNKQYEEMTSPARPPPKLKPMTSLPSSKNAEKAQTVRGPYKNGDPAHNHVCDLCGMIYRYRPNMFKHRQLCLRLQPDMRISYKCAHCFMTYLVFKKFHSHITWDHKKKDLICAVCNSKFKTANDYLTHQESHRGRQAQVDGTREASKSSTQNAQVPLKERNDAHDVDTTKAAAPYTCALCGQNFSTKIELREHRKLHLKVKIYSCVICHSMFSNVGSLEIHMKDHGIEDANERNANISCVEYGSLNEDVKIEDAMNTSDPGMQCHKCGECGKVLSSLANLRRHSKIAHRNSQIYNCAKCSKVFKQKEMYDHHMQLEHKSTKSMYQCPQCPKSFVFPSNFNYHFRTSHLEKSRDGYPCDICGKVFVEEASLKIHKGWHNRANSRLSTRFILGNETSTNVTPNNNPPNKEPADTESKSNNTERPARARKSFPNAPPPSLIKSPTSFECQVCNDRFNDVTELRSHLWDVHCARNKPEKNLSNNELQCELCTNIFPDQETLKVHMLWHKTHPILSHIQKTYYNCDVCDRSYSTKKVLWKHKRLHKATSVASNFQFQSLNRKPMTSQYICTFCRKLFSTNQSLQRHKLNFHSLQNQRPQQAYNVSRLSSENEPKTKRPKFDIDDNSSKPSSATASFVGERKRSFMCHLCKKLFPNMSILYKHKQVMHKSRKDIKEIQFTPMSTQDGKYSCNVCLKEFPRLSNLRQHFTIKHKKIAEYPCNVQSCSLMFSTPDFLKNHELTHTNMMFNCKLCDRHVFNKEAMTHHITNVHNTVYEIESKLFHKETDLNIYVVKDAIGATCPLCDVKYPNNKAMKIHYIKFHDNAD